MTLTHDKHVLACALLVEKQHGEHGPVYIAEQIGRLVLDGDDAGVAMWQEIAAAYQRVCLAQDGTALPN